MIWVSHERTSIIQPQIWNGTDNKLTIAPVPKRLRPARNWLNPSGCSVPHPHKPRRLMKPRFLGCETLVAEQYTIRARGRSFCSSSTAMAVCDDFSFFNGPFPVVLGIPLASSSIVFALWHSSSLCFVSRKHLLDSNEVVLYHIYWYNILT